MFEAGEILVRHGLLDDGQLRSLRESIDNGTPILDVAVQRGLVAEEMALRALAEEVGLPFVDLNEVDVDLSLLVGFPQKLIHRDGIFPLYRENGSLVVATSVPFHLYPLDDVSVATGRSVQPVLAARTEILKLIKNHLGVGSETVEGLIAQSTED